MTAISSNGTLSLLAFFILVEATYVNAQSTATFNLPDSIVVAGTQVKWLTKVQSFCEGPIYDPVSGVVYWTEQKGNNTAHWPIWKYDTKTPNVEGKPFITDSRQANGLEIDPQGFLVAAQDTRISRFKTDGTLDKILVESGKNSIPFGQANDLSFLKDGSFYFTDLKDQVFYFSAEGTLKVVATGLAAANGVQVVEEANKVYVNEVAGGKISVFDRASDGSLSNRKTFISMTGPDGSDMDAHGNWYVSSYHEGNLHVINGAGQILGKINFTISGAYDSRSGTPGNTSNCAFGGPDLKTLFITGDGGLFSITLKIPGRPRPGTTTDLKFRASTRDQWVIRRNSNIPWMKTYSPTLSHLANGKQLGKAPQRNITLKLKHPPQLRGKSSDE